MHSKTTKKCLTKSIKLSQANAVTFLRVIKAQIIRTNSTFIPKENSKERMEIILMVGCLRIKITEFATRVLLIRLRD